MVENITSLDLSNNSIKSVDVDSFAIFYELLSLNLSSNKISSLDNSTFYPLKKLETLDVSFNSLTQLGGGLISLFNLRSVWFNNNNISYVDPHIVGQENIGLRYFNLNNNSLTYLDPWPYTTYQSHQRRLDREFFVQHNQISRLTNYMNWTYDLQYPFEVLLNLQWNKLETITVDTLRQYEPDMSSQAIFTVFLTFQANVTHNPFFCDCKLYEMTEIVRRGIFRYTKVEQYRYRCGSPSAVTGIDFLHDLDYDQFVCNVTSGCPTGCFCQDRPHNDTFFIDCNGAGLTEMPDVIPNHSRSKLEIILDNNNIDTLKNTSYLTNIYNISMAGNKLNRLDESVLSVMNASRLDFRNNRISTLPREIKKFSYSSVLLSGNPLECDCDSMWLAEWIQLDGEEGDMSLTCDSKTGTHTIADISLKILGCTNELIIIICVCLGVMLALLVIGLIFAKRCPYETRVLLHKIFRIRPGKKYEADNDDQKEVDIYIAFDNMSEDVIGWVRYFLKKLNRKKPVYSVLNPARFMEPGSEAVGIPKWIGRSKRMIIILSDKIFENEWRCFEIEDAERRIIEATARKNEKNSADKQKSENNDNDSCRIDIENDTNLEGDESSVADENEPSSINMEGDENLDKAPRIIYIIFNSSDLLKSKLDEDRWIERIGDRRNLRKNNSKEFDLKAKAWQEKLHQEPWKSRLAGKVVLSPDDKMFWSKLRYELPPKGNGKGDGNFTFKRPDQHEDLRIVHDLRQQARDREATNATAAKQDRNKGSPNFTHFADTSEKARVHRNKDSRTNNPETNRKGGPSVKQTANPKLILNQLRTDKNMGVYSISGSKEATNNSDDKANNASTDRSNQLLDVLNGIGVGITERGAIQRVKRENTEETITNGQRVLKDLMARAGGQRDSPSNSRPGSAAKEGDNADQSRRIFTIGTKEANVNDKLTNVLGYSNNMRSDVRSNRGNVMNRNVSSNLRRKISSGTIHSESSNFSSSSDA
jgi:hypothetical protein